MESFKEISPVEVEGLIDSLFAPIVADISTPRWHRQHAAMEQLNVEARRQVRARVEEQVVESLISKDKVRILVQDLLSIEAWKAKVLENIAGKKFKKVNDNNYLSLYIICHHEASVVSLLEIVANHLDILESLGDAVIDMADYCCRKLVTLQAMSSPKLEVATNAQEMMAEGGGKRFRREFRKIEYSICFSCLGIMRFFADLAPKSLPLLQRIISQNDVILNVVPLFAKKPWTKVQDGKTYKWENSKWVEVQKGLERQMSRYEGNAWLCIYNLMMEPEVRRRYHITDHRKEVIMTLRQYINVDVVDQIPMLEELHRALEELSLLAPGSTEKDTCFIEQSPEIHTLLTHDVDFNAIADSVRERLINPDIHDRMADAQGLADIYTSESFHEILETPICAQENCGKPATKRCSRCKSEWYCSRKCQVDNWVTHKSICDSIIKKEEEYGV